MALKELTATLKIDSVKALKSLEKFNKFLGTIAKSVDSLQTKLTAMKTNLNVEIGTSGKGVAATGKGAEKAAKGIDKLDKSVKKTSESTEELGQETKKTTRQFVTAKAGAVNHSRVLKNLGNRYMGVRAEIMLMHTSLGTINRRLKITAPLFKAVAKAAGKVKSKFNSSVKPAFENFRNTSTRSAIAVTALTTATFAFVAQWAKTTDAMAKSGDKFNVPFKELEGLAFAAELAGASGADVSDAIKDLSLNMADAAKDKMHPFNEALAQMGLSLDDLKGKTKTEQIGIIADGLNRVEDASLRTALGMKTLGPASIQLGAFLKQGSKEIALSAKELERMGIALSPEQAKEAAMFNDEFTRTRAILTAVAGLIAAKLSPRIRKLITRFRGWVLVNKDLIATRILEWINRFVDLVTDLAPKLLQIAKFLADIAKKASMVVDELGGIEVVLASAGVAWGLFKIAALASLNPVLALVLVTSAAITGMLVKLAQSRRKNKSNAETAFDPVDKGGISDEDLSKTAEGRTVLDNEKLIRGLQRDIDDVAGGLVSDDLREERVATSTVQSVRDKIFRSKGGEDEQRLRALEAVIARLRVETDTAVVGAANSMAAAVRKAAGAVADDPDKKRFGELQTKLLAEGNKFSKKNLAELKKLAIKLGGKTIFGLPERSGGGGSAAAADRDAPPLTLQQQIAKLLGTGTGLNVSSFRPSGVGTLVQHFDARVILEAAKIDITVNSPAQGKDLGRDIGQGFFDKWTEDLKRAFAAQEGLIRG